MPFSCNPDSPSDNQYEELCVLAAVGEIDQAEFEELQRHLAVCASCRALYADVRRISSADLGIGAIHLIQESTEDRVIGQLNGPDLLRRLKDRASSVSSVRQIAGVPHALQTDRTLSPWFARTLFSLRMRQSLILQMCAVAILAIFVTSSAYWLYNRQLTSTLSDLRGELANSQAQNRITVDQHQEATQMLQYSQGENEALKRELAAIKTNIAQLQLQVRNSDAQLQAVSERATEKDRELDRSASQLDEKEKKIKALQDELTFNNEQLQKQMASEADLQAKLRAVEKPTSERPASRQDLEMSESDARELLGARDLHIVDVYDIASSGNFRRVYGRVYYVEKKYFIFYAFNLQNAKGERKAVAFQAWGFRESDQSKPESLGLFYIDDAKTNRWALKVGDPAVLDHIDTVSVTVEPPGGSQFPRGHKLLYASLTGPPNHP